MSRQSPRCVQLCTMTFILVCRIKFTGCAKYGVKENSEDRTYQSKLYRNCGSHLSAFHNRFKDLQVNLFGKQI